MGGGEGAHCDGECSVDGVGTGMSAYGIAVFDGRGES